MGILVGVWIVGSAVASVARVSEGKAGALAIDSLMTRTIGITVPTKKMIPTTSPVMAVPRLPPLLPSAVRVQVPTSGRRRGWCISHVGHTIQLMD